jgi:hypothetical protein
MTQPVARCLSAMLLSRACRLPCRDAPEMVTLSVALIETLKVPHAPKS